MSFNPPSTITFSGGAWQTSGRYYSHIGSGLYNLRNSDGTSNASDKDIKFTDSSGTLTLDVNPTTGTAAPSTFSSGGSDVTSGTVVAGDTINLKEAGALRASFTLVNFYTSGSGGGTGTEGAGSPSGTVVKIGTSANAATVKFTIDSSSPSSSGVVSYDIVRDGVVYYTITGHTAGTPTETIVGWYNSRWELRLVSTSGLYESQTLGFIVKEVNVSQNFW
jgi:hypothetical protein